MLCLFASAAIADEPQLGVVKVSHQVQQFIESQCIDCHEGDSAEAGLDLSIESQNDRRLDFSQWVRIHDRVETHEMPPPDDSIVDSAERDRFLKLLSGQLREYESKNRFALGSAGSRRLTNLQLERTLHDLLAIAEPLARSMPDEPRTDGFTGLVASQSMSHFLLESHLNVIDAALDAAMGRITDPVRTWQRNYTARDLARENPNRRCRDPEMRDDVAVVWSSGLIFYGR